MPTAANNEGVAAIVIVVLVVVLVVVVMTWLARRLTSYATTDLSKANYAPIIIDDRYVSARDLAIYEVPNSAMS